jgi:hypothetical protein
MSQEADLAESRTILQKIERRELYKCVGVAIFFILPYIIPDVWLQLFRGFR